MAKQTTTTVSNPKQDPDKAGLNLPSKKPHKKSGKKRDNIDTKK